MEKPDINSKKYIYYHKKLGKKMFNNQKYLEDCKKFSEQNIVLPQANVIKSVCECEPKTYRFRTSDSNKCIKCGEEIE